MSLAIDPDVSVARVIAKDQLLATFNHDPAASTTHSHESAVTDTTNRLSHRYGFGCPADTVNLVEDPISRSSRGAGLVL
jgi:hypothetical protein